MTKPIIAVNVKTFYMKMLNSEMSLIYIKKENKERQKRVEVSLQCGAS